MNFLNHRARNTTSAAFILAATTLLSKLLGLLKIRIFTSLFTTDQLDIYFAAFRIPDLLYNILILGGISSCFIPIFAQYWQKSKEEAWRFCNNVFSIFFLILVVLSLILGIFTPLLMKVVAPGFKGEKMDLVILLTRIMFLSPILLGISNIFGSLLQYFSRFLVYSLAPVMYNLGIIFGALFLGPKIGIVGLAFGVVFGALLHLLIQLPSVILVGFRFKPVFDFFHRGLRKLLKMMVPRTIGLFAQQVNLIIITALASTLLAGSISIFNIANDIQFIPISLFGISFAVAAFPSLSRSFFNGQRERFVQKFASTFSQILFFTVPLSVLFFILRAQLVRIIAGTQLFSWQDTRLTAGCLGLFSLSIFAQSLIPLLSRAFYSFQDTKTPVKISIASIILNIFLAFVLVSIFANNGIVSSFFQSFLKLEELSDISVVSLPLAFSLSSVFNFVWLFFALEKRLQVDLKRILRDSFLRISLLSVFSGFVCYGLLYLFAPIFKLNTLLGVSLQAGISGGVALIFYLFLSKKFNFREYQLTINSLKSVESVEQEM